MILRTRPPGSRRRRLDEPAPPTGESTTGRRRRLRLWSGIAAGAALALVACADGGPDSRVVGTLERDRIELIAESNDPIVEIAVREGDLVDASQVLVRLDDTRLRARVAQAEAAREEAHARLAEALRGPRPERILEARARLAGTESTLVTARRELERAEALAQRDYGSRSRLDLQRAAHEEALARRDEARAALDALLEGTTIEELDQARSALARAEAALVEVRVQSERLTVRSPTRARVDALPFELGERPPAGAVVAVLLAEQAPYARVYVPAPLRPRVSPGTAARVWIDGLERPYAGRLRTVSSEASFTPYFALTERDRSRLTYVAEVDLLDADAADLPSGFPVEVELELGEVAQRAE